MIPQSQGTALPVMQATTHHINQFASEGLRTLAVAVRSLNSDEFAEFEEKFKVASQSLENREEMIRAVYDSIETDLELIGAIGVEDKYLKSSFFISL